MINNITIKGRLAAAPEMRATPSGVSVTMFTVAVTGRKPKEADAPTYWIDCIAWRGLADFVERYFTKGQEIAVSGYLQTRMYEDKNGYKRKAVEVVAENVDFCGSKQESKNTGNSFTSGFDANEYEEIDDNETFPF